LQDWLLISKLRRVSTMFERAYYAQRSRIQMFQYWTSSVSEPLTAKMLASIQGNHLSTTVDNVARTGQSSKALAYWRAAQPTQDMHTEPQHNIRTPVVVTSFQLTIRSG
jgi:hypothetical protein